MFDIGFFELLLVGVIALLVLGPERLPGAARALGLWVGKAKRSLNAIKTEIDRELKIQEMQEMRAELEKTEDELRREAALESLNQGIEALKKDVSNLPGTPADSEETQNKS